MNLKLKYPFGFLYFVSFIFSMQYGLVLYINSSFLELTAGKEIVGILFAIASLLSILFILQMPRILNRFGNYKTTIFFVICNASALILLGTGKSSQNIIISYFFYTITNYSLLLMLDVFIGNYTSEGEIGRTRGLFLMIRNLAILSSPLIAVLIVTNASYNGVYIGAGFLTLVSLPFIVPHLKNFKDPIYRRISVLQTFEKIGGNKNLKIIYASQFLLCFFYSWMIIYMPIYLNQFIGLSWKDIGFVFTIMLIPFVLVDYPLGRWSDTTGEKKILIAGFFVISMSTLILVFIKTQSVLTWALILFTTRIGAATIEVMNESYFFKKIRLNDAGLIGVFRNMFPFAFIISPLIATPVLFLVPSFEYLFLALSVIMLSGFFVILRLKDLR